MENCDVKGNIGVFLTLTLLAESLVLFGAALWTHFHVPMWVISQYDIVGLVAISYCMWWAKAK